MGAFIVNINVRTEDRQSVEAAVRALHTEGAWVTGPRNGWVTVYEARASTQSRAWIQELSQSLSEVLYAPVIAFLVHDSGILKYWLYDGGRPVDEYNSCPDYFSATKEPAAPAGGDPDRLLPYCVPGTHREQVRQVLVEGPKYGAEDRLLKVAALLGIDPDRASADFTDFAVVAYPEEQGATFFGYGQRPGGVAGSGRAKHSGPGVNSAVIDPQVQRLVHAARDNNVGEIARLFAAGVNLNGTAPGQPTTQSRSFTMQMLTGDPIPITPLVAALAHGHHDATRRLLAAGADPNAADPVFGTAVHAAAVSGDVELLRLVLDAGGAVDGRNEQQQTPLLALQDLRPFAGQMSQVQQMQSSLGYTLPGQPGYTVPSDEALAACEQLLRERAT